MKVKRYFEFFNEEDNYIDAKMQELKDLIDDASVGQNIIYEWENKDDHEVIVGFSIDNLSIKYNFDIDGMVVVKTKNDEIDFTEDVDSVESGLSIIEKDIQKIIGISEKMKY
jgi:hypothetical protein